MLVSEIYSSRQGEGRLTGATKYFHKNFWLQLAMPFLRHPLYILGSRRTAHFDHGSFGTNSKNVAKTCGFDRW